MLIENAASGSLVSLEGIGGKKNEGGTYDIQSTEILLPFALSLRTGINNASSKGENGPWAVRGGLVDTPELTRGEGASDRSMYIKFISNYRWVKQIVQRVRENNEASEFGGIGSTCGTIRTSLVEIWK